MTQLSDFPPDVQALAKQAVAKMQGHCAPITFTPWMEAICAAVMADRIRRVPAKALTAHQKRVMDYLTWFIAKNDIAPSYDEIQAHLGLKSKSSIHRVIHELEERGAIQRLPNRARAITIIANPASQQEQA